MPFYPLIHLVSWMFSMWKSKSRLQMFQLCKLLTFVLFVFVFSQFFDVRVWSSHSQGLSYRVALWEKLFLCVCVWWFNFVFVIIDLNPMSAISYQGKFFLCQRWAKDLLIQQEVLCKLLTFVFSQFFDVRVWSGHSQGLSYRVALWEKLYSLCVCLVI